MFRRMIWCGVILVITFTFYIRGQSTAMKAEDCLTCHGDKTLEAVTARGKTLNLYVPENPLMKSVHEGLSCQECHIGAKSFDDVPHAEQPLGMGCAECHAEQKAAVDKDIHGMGVLAGNPRTPQCWTCHGSHQILPLSSPESVFAKRNQPDTCGKCHGNDRLFEKERGITKRNLVSRYKSSVHWLGIEKGKNAASCTDCHGRHNILSSAAENSEVSRLNVANTCKKCHPEETKIYWNGAHGTALKYGNNDVPTCTTCHGDHDMASLRIRSGDAKQWASTQVCIWCHGNERMMTRYGLDTSPVVSYMNDFHGLTQRGTMGASATCADCHEAHHSLPSNHPASRMHISNRGPACGKCHGKVTDSFVRSFTHKQVLHQEGLTIERIVRYLYIALITVSVGGMLLYIFMVWWHAVRKKITFQRQQKHVLRMNRFELVSHLILFISFTLLVITGFALKYPETFWARWIFELGVTEAVRGFIHRLAAVVMTLNMIIFVIYMFTAQRGKCLFKESLPRKVDFTDFFKSVKYYLGIQKEGHGPKFGVFNFAEKFEFWALMWGTVVMVVTGLILWFPKAMPNHTPVWVMSVSRIIHYYEALLAALAILIWHGFHTILHPDEYPMNTSWLTGYITEEQATHHFTDEAIKKLKTEKPAVSVPEQVPTSESATAVVEEVPLEQEKQ